MNVHSKLRTKGTTSLRERLKEATRTAILDAAELVLARDGVQTARMEDVASQAGVAVGTLYNYFSDRAALLEALLDDRRAELLARIDATLAEPSASFELRLQAFLTTLIAHFQHHTGLFAIHLEAEVVLRGRRERALKALLDRTGRLLKEGVASGVLRDDDAAIYPAILMGMLRGLFVRHLYGGGTAPTPETAQSLTRIFLRGVAKESR